MDGFSGFPALVVSRKTGAEAFHTSGEALSFDLLSFWQWAASDVTNNALRGIIAEYLVAQALGQATGVRVEWDRHDLRTAAGTAVEVKSSAYCQSWAQTKLSDIVFDIAPTLGWDAATNTYETASRRQAEVYVFAILHHRDKLTLDPLNVSHWSFFVLNTSALDKTVLTQKSIRLGPLLALKPIEVGFGKLRETIEQVTATR